MSEKKLKEYEEMYENVTKEIEELYKKQSEIAKQKYAAVKDSIKESKALSEAVWKVCNSYGGIELGGVRDLQLKKLFDIWKPFMYHDEIMILGKRTEDHNLSEDFIYLRMDDGEMKIRFSSMELFLKFIKEWDIKIDVSQIKKKKKELEDEILDVEELLEKLEKI